MSDLSPLSGVKRKLDFGTVRSANDPSRTSTHHRYEVGSDPSATCRYCPPLRRPLLHGGPRTRLIRFVVEFLGNQSNHLARVLIAIESEKKLWRTTAVDQLQAAIFRIGCSSQGCRDGFRNMTQVGQASQVQKVDRPAERLGSSWPTAKATVVLPMPPAPSSITKHPSRSLWLTSPSTASRPIVVIGRVGGQTGDSCEDGQSWFSIRTQPRPDLARRGLQGAVGYGRSGNCSREASVEGKVRDGGCELSLGNTVTDCTMKMRG
jgi:hypothetical protein